MNHTTDDLQFPTLVVGILVGGTGMLFWIALFAFLMR